MITEPRSGPVGAMPVEPDELRAPGAATCVEIQHHVLDEDAPGASTRDARARLTVEARG